MRNLIITAACLAVTGCGVTGKIAARHDYQDAVADYRSCLAANPGNIHACDGARLSMEAAQQLYNNSANGIRPFGGFQ